jgi:hypothetical protein
MFPSDYTILETEECEEGIQLADEATRLTSSPPSYGAESKCRENCS